MVVNKKKQSEFLKSLDRKKKQEKQLEKQSKKLNNQQKKQNEQKKKQSGGGKKKGSGNNGAKSNNSQKGNADKLGIGFRNQKSEVEKFGMGFGKTAKSTQSKLNREQKKPSYTKQSNADKSGVGFHKSKSGSSEPVNLNLFTDKVISDKSIKRTKAQTDLTLKNGFASPKSEHLRKDADESINPSKTSKAKKKLAASVFDDEYKRIRTAHPDMAETEILDFLASRDDYGQAFVDEVKAQRQEYQKNLAEKKGTEAARRQAVSDVFGKEQRNYGKNIFEISPLDNRKAAGPYDLGEQEFAARRQADEAINRYRQKGDSGLTEAELFSRRAKEKGLTEIGLAFQDLAFQTGDNKEKAKETAQRVWSEFKAAGGGDVLQAIKYMDDNLLGVEASVLMDEVKKIADAERRQYVQQNLEAAQKQTRQNILSGANIDPRQTYESEAFQKATDVNRAYNWMDATTATNNKLQNACRAVVQGYLSAYAGAARLFGGERAANAVRRTDEMAIANKASAETAFGRVGVDVLSQVGMQVANLPMMALGSAAGGATKGAKALQTLVTGAGYGMSSAGQELQHAYDAGATAKQARASAAVSALMEVAFGGNVEAGGKYITNTLKKILGEAGIEAFMEGSTEYLTSVGQNAASRLIYDNPDGKSAAEILKEEFANKENWYAAGLGALMGGGMGAMGGLGGAKEMKQARLVKEFAQKAGMSEQEVTAAVREGRIRELASFANDKADAKRQAVKFVDSVQKSIKGETSSSDILVVNEKTPRILQKYGAENRPLTMSQSVMRKIAYPEGYMGGKHNLGFVALAKLPEQLADPMAVLKSASQKNSLVIITELVDTENRPVIVPIHLDKSGRIGLTNEVPSMYSKDGFSNFVKAQEKAGNILYTKKDRVLDDIPVNGLQLSEMGNQADPIFNNSISQGARNMQDLSGKSLENYRRMSSFAEAKGGRIVVRNDMEAGNPGFIIKNDDGTFDIVVADEALVDYVVMGHELTHALEGTEEYGEYAEFIQNELESRGADIAAIKQAVSDVYAEHSRILDDPGAEKELIAMYTAKHLFDDQVVINRLAVEKPNLFQRIWEWIQDKIASLRGKDAAFYIDTRKRFIAAYRSAGGAYEGRWGEDTGRQDTIGQTTDGRKFVQIDDDIFDDIADTANTTDIKKYFRIFLRNKYPNGINIKNQLVRVERKGIDEFSAGGDTKHLYSLSDKSLFMDKIRIANNIDELVSSADNYINEAPNHGRKDDIVGFGRGNVLLKIGEHKYKADVLVAIKKDGNALFYDVVHLEKTNYGIKKLPSRPALAESKGYGDLESSSINTNISQNDNGVNNSIRKNGRSDTQNSIAFDIDEIISRNQKGDGKAWSETVKEFDKVKKKVKTDGKQEKSLYEGLFEVFGKKKPQAEVLKGSLADVLGIETESGRKVAASLEEKIGKKRIISQKDRLAYFENLFGEYRKSHGSKSMLGRTKLWQIFTTYLDDLQEANGLRRNMPRMKDVPRFEIGGKKKSGEADKPQSLVELFDKVFGQKAEVQDSAKELNNFEFLAQALEHKIAGTLVDPREKRAVQMLDKVFGQKAKGGGDENFRDFNRAKKDLSFEDLTEISGSDIINMESCSEIQTYFHDKYGIDVEGFDKKNIEDMRFVFAGIDDVLREFPDALGCMRKIVYNSKLKVYGKMNDRGVCQIGSSGIRSYGTGVHETIHALDFYRSDPDTYSFSEGIYKIALKELKLKKNSKQLQKLFFDFMGYSEDCKRVPEILAYAIETERGKGNTNSLTRKIYEILKEVYKK